MPQPLNSKEAALFRQLIRNYEAKQYKKGLKAAEQILKKNPDHGDTLAMKALIINSQGRTEEAFSLAKVALMKDMRSHVCWHVYGLLWRAIKNFDEAIKAYKQALKLEPESQQILRDLALLQAQMRDFQGYIESRRLMLQARPQWRQNWTALAIANHLSGDLKNAESILTKYEETLRTAPPKGDIEHSEASLYKNSIIAEQKDFERALEHLQTIEKISLDRTAAMELKAEYLNELKRSKEAEDAYRALIERNPENGSYYEGLEKAVGVDRNSKDAHKRLIELYSSFEEKHLRADAPRRLPLNFLEGDDFREKTEAYLARMLTKGVPSTFANIKALYSDASKKATVEKVALDFASKQNSTPTNGKDKDQDHATPTPKSSALYFLAQHYNYKLSRDLNKASKYIDEAIELVPKSVDYHMTKARVLKHQENYAEAAKVMEAARELDLKDRYINSKSAKYQLRNDDNAKAIDIMGKFTRNDNGSTPFGDLLDMQCVWYITEDGESYARQGKNGLALKRFTQIYNIFDIWQEDQFDFHSFSLKKGQIRAYISMVRWEDNLREHPFFSRAAVSAIKIYLRLHEKLNSDKAADKSKLNGNAHKAQEGGVEDAKDALERKKAAKKARKAEKAEADKAALKKASNPTAASSDTTEGKKEDDDPKGEKLVATKEPLKDAMKFVTPLLAFSPRLLDAQKLGFEVYLLRKKYLPALKCVISASKLDDSKEDVKAMAERLSQAVKNADPPLNTTVTELIQKELSAL